ncbi:uncharacterized protein LOC116352249 isoform X2 [Contarinia nasturtii]|uniref:uncharacterized protein LOC116352249 isoform X2 n=1 Tax=Contarinia nasturtii TaxID=265458 RepID=UPI0012D3A9FF|nr:uncharacterized protein LOC116352249 isoform X2 [Contarinia nasturtii]
MATTLSELRSKCRLCFTRKGENDVTNGPILQQKIHELFGIEIKDTDRYSKMICSNCTSKTHLFTFHKKRVELGQDLYTALVEMHEKVFKSKMKNLQDLQSKCRLCFVEVGKKDITACPSLLNAIRELHDIEIKEADVYTKMICADCAKNTSELQVHKQEVESGKLLFYMVEIDDIQNDASQPGSSGVISATATAKEYQLNPTPPLNEKPPTPVKTRGRTPIAIFFNG